MNGTVAASSWFLYLIRCADGSLYTGISTDVGRRFQEHELGGVKAARYLRGRGPLELVYCSPAGDRALASRLEYHTKRMPVVEKRRLIKSQTNIQQWLHEVVSSE